MGVGRPTRVSSCGASGRPSRWRSRRWIGRTKSGPLPPPLLVRIVATSGAFAATLFAVFRRPALTDHVPEAVFCWARHFAANHWKALTQRGCGRAALSSCFVGSFIVSPVLGRFCGRRLAGAVAPTAGQSWRVKERSRTEIATVCVGITTGVAERAATFAKIVGPSDFGRPGLLRWALCGPDRILPACMFC